ncbi:MAG: thiamine pyrophosphate-dependent enzyme [bacterium]
MGKLLLSGNEAIAFGAFHAGARVGTAYPGTPSTEILENFSTYPDIYCEWSVNEKVAFEVAIGAALAGARTIVAMKHVGLNVAADPLFTSSYIGVKAGLVIVCADDPDMHSSQNEQDNRHYARSAKIPMLEPSDSHEAYTFTKLAFELSEKYDTPVLVRTTTRISHSKTVVFPDSHRVKLPPPEGFNRNVKKYVMIPAYARLRHVEVEKRLTRIKKECNNLEINHIEQGDKKRGFITSGISYNYAKEVFPGASILKLGMTNPLPERIIKKFCQDIKKVIVVEELDPFLEIQIKAMGLNVEGKRYFPLTSELNPDIIHRALIKKEPEDECTINIPIPPRPPSLCPGCPHRKVFEVIHKLGLMVSGDIGCYTLGVLPPYFSIDTCIDMGASIGAVQGIEIAEGDAYKNNVVAVLGDSTFAHSGITGLLNAAYNKRHSLIIVLDNGTTAMTGMQPNPLSGERITGEATVALDYKKLAEAVGIGEKNFFIVDAYNDKEIEEHITALLVSKKLSLLVVKGMCVILKRKKMKKARS